MRLRFALWTLSLWLAGCGVHSDDATLKESFVRSYSALSNIVSELKAAPHAKRIEWDGVTLIVNTSQTNPPVLTNKLLPHFSAIKQRLLVMSAGEGSQVWFYFSRRGLSVSGSLKGIVYQETLPDRLVEDTDRSSRANAPFTVFRALQTNWFIFYSR